MIDSIESRGRAICLQQLFSIINSIVNKIRMQYRFLTVSEFIIGDACNLLHLSIKTRWRLIEKVWISCPWMRPRWAHRFSSSLFNCNNMLCMSVSENPCGDLRKCEPSLVFGSLAILLLQHWWSPSVNVKPITRVNQEPDGNIR